MEYIRGSSVSDLEFLEGDTSPLFGNATTLTCSLYNYTDDGQEECVEYVKYDYWFAILTLFFIYLPSVNVIGTLYGPVSAGKVGMKVSLGMTVGGAFTLIGYFMSNPTAAIIGWYVMILSGGIFAMGLVNYYSTDNKFFGGDDAETSILHI